MIELLEHEALYGSAKKGGRRGRVVDADKDGRTKKGRGKKETPKKPKDEAPDEKR